MSFQRFHFFFFKYVLAGIFGKMNLALSLAKNKPNTKIKKRRLWHSIFVCFSAADDMIAVTAKNASFDEDLAKGVVKQVFVYNCKSFRYAAGGSRMELILWL